MARLNGATRDAKRDDASFVDDVEPGPEPAPEPEPEPEPEQLAGDELLVQV